MDEHEPGCDGRHGTTSCGVSLKPAPRILNHIFDYDLTPGKSRAIGGDEKSI
jgi:hypothetical protein